MAVSSHCQKVLRLLYEMILYNYPPKGRWIVIYVYRDMKCRGIYLALFTNPEGDSYFSIYQIKFIVFLVFVCMTASFIAQFSPSENFSKRDAILVSVANQWIACKDIPSYGSQPKWAKIAIHWFGKYKRGLFWKWLSLITNWLIDWTSLCKDAPCSQFSSHLISVK